MSHRRVLLLTAQRLTAYHWQGGRLGETLVFNADEAGLVQFAEYLDAWPASPIFFLVDMVEEEFREETIPHVSGRNRKSVIDLRLGRMFQDATYVRTDRLGRDDGARRDDRMLFSALLRPDQLAPWLNNIERRDLPIAGIYTVASISRFLLKAIPVTSPYALVVTQQSGGLRQSLFVNGRLRLSRLAVVPRLQRRVQSSYILGEIEKFRRYLNALRLLPSDAQLDAYVISDEPTLEALRRQMPSDVNARLNRVPLPQVARRLRCADLGAGPNADAVFAHILARQQPPNEYAPARLTRAHNLLRTGHWLKVASLLILVGAFGWSSLTAVRAINRAQDTRDLQERTAFYEQRYEIARGRLPASPASAKDLEAVVDVAGRLADYSARPAPLLSTLGGVFAAHPGLRLSEIAWSAGMDPDARVDDGVARRIGNTVRNALGRRAELPEAPPAYFIATVSGEVVPFDGNYRLALEQVRRLADDLRALPRARRVELLALPLEIGSADRMSGDAKDNEQKRQAPFEVLLVLERPGLRPAGEASS